MPVYSLDDHRPEIDDSCWIAPDAQICGKVKLADEVNIWFGAVLRGDIETITIGCRTNIQDLAMCHTDIDYPLTIGTNCTIGHSAIVHGCTIGDASLIGMGATLLNGVVIGKCCIIGAGSLILENTEIPDFSLVVGSPAKIIRKLDKSVLARLLASADNYVDRSRVFASKLTPVS